MRDESGTVATPEKTDSVRGVWMGFERVLIPVGIVLLVAALILVLAWLFQRSLIYFPSSREPSPVETVLPGGEAVAFTTEDGLTLAAWFLPPSQQPPTKRAAPPASPAAEGATPDKTGNARAAPAAPSAAVAATPDNSGSARAMPAVLVFNGNAGDREMRAPLAIALSDAGLAVLLFDYRGYSGNPGSPSEVGLVADARAAVEYLAAREDVDPGQIVYFGESLGAAVAVALAAERPPAALILRSPFTSLADMAKVHYPFLPAGLLLKDRFNSIDTIRAIASPLLVIVGEIDRIVPAAQSRRLYEAATGPSHFLQFDGTGHNDYEFLAGKRFIRAIIDFLNTTLQPD